jgi:hypothetical protein
MIEAVIPSSQKAVEAHSFPYNLCPTFLKTWTLFREAFGLRRVLASLCRTVI